MPAAHVSHAPGPAEVAPASAALPPVDEAERRQISVMFCDLVGSTALSARLDPEDFRTVLSNYHAACTEVIGCFGGYPAQYLGDGLLVYFGYPAAHEDDAQRAVLAGLGIVETVGDLSTRLESERGVALRVRIGIHTGLVVVGDIGEGAHRERLALGETPNIAARLQTLAEPGTIVVSSATHRLVRNTFECLDLGPQRIRGVDSAIATYRIVARLPAGSAAGETVATSSAFVGRERQVDLLVERWRDAAEGIGHVMLLSGEPGIGKSRLVRALKERVAGSAQRTLEGYCSPYHRYSPMHLVAQLLCSTVGISTDQTPDQKLGRLETVLDKLGIPGEESVPLFAPLLGLPADQYPPLDWTPQRQREKSIEIALAILWSVAAPAPILLIVEDLQWADPSSLDLLTLLVEQAGPYRIFAVFTGRPEFRPPWPPRSHASQVMVNRLPHRHVVQMVAHLTAGKSLPADLLQQIVDRTDGVPLFVEELTKTVLESGLVEVRGNRYELKGPLPLLGIPSTLQDSLAARLDRLGEVKAVAQIGATIGREFSFELLAAVSSLESERLHAALNRLIEAELIYCRGVPPSATYVFKHALIQEAAYQSLLRSVRRQFHSRIAVTLEERFPGMRDAHPELAAHHYTEAGLAEQAVPYWQRSGERAILRSASAEAIAHLDKGIELLATLPDTPLVREQELELQIALGPVLAGLRGFAAPETVRAYERARQLCSQLSGTPRVLPALWGLSSYFATQGNLRRAREVGEELLERARQTGNPDLLLQAHHALWPVTFAMGDLVAARNHIEAGLALYDPDKHPALAHVYGGHDARVCAHAWNALALWMLGYPRRAEEATAAAHQWASQLSQPHSSAVALAYGALLRRLRREDQAAHELADACVALSEEQRFPQWLGMARICKGSALAALGRVDAGLAEIQEGLGAYLATGAGAERPMFLTLLAEVQCLQGAWQDGCVTISEAMSIIGQNGEHACEPELHRIRGELALARSPADLGDAEASFCRALELARALGAKAWGLRAATSLARLWRLQGMHDKARELLAEVCAGFTEDYDTADLSEAKTLLDEAVSG